MFQNKHYKCFRFDFFFPLTTHYFSNFKIRYKKREGKGRGKKELYYKQNSKKKTTHFFYIKKSIESGKEKYSSTLKKERKKNF